MSLLSRKIGILGGGQLARMLAIRGREMGLHIEILSENKSDPAVAFASLWHKGNPNKIEDVKKFSNQVDILTFESEFVPAYVLNKAVLRKSKCFPRIENLAQIQDRWPQKEMLWDYDIPTSPFMKINGKDDLDLAFKVFKGRMVLKKRMGGYDGYGTFVIETKMHLTRFKTLMKGYETQFIAEAFIAYKSEKSLLFARNLKGKIVSYPLLTTLQKNNQCDQVWGPSMHPNLKTLTKKIHRLLDQINYVGLIAFELFDTGSELMVNELAPRVHNTGHITQDAFQIDQFELHLRAILNMELPTTIAHTSAFLMQNLLGTTVAKPRFPKTPTGRLHWYDKQDNRPRRKMGHINYIGDSVKKLQLTALKERRQIKL